MCMPAASRTGNDGCESTGASIDGSSIIERAKLPVKHMPIAPTPLPPQSGCACAASARSQAVTGLEALEAKARNSELMQTLASTHNALPILIGAPGSPKRFGIHTVKPASHTKRAKRATYE